MLTPRQDPSQSPTKVVVPGGGIEPPWCYHRGILSPVRLPIPPSRHGARAPDFPGTSAAQIIRQLTVSSNESQASRL